MAHPSPFSHRAALLDRLAAAVPPGASAGDRARLFLGWAAGYWRHLQTYRLRAGRMHPETSQEERDRIGGAMVEDDAQRYEYCALMVHHAPPLLEAMRRAGLPRDPLRRFLHRIDGGGGPEAAAPAWEAAKILLQEVAALPDGRGGRPLSGTSHGDRMAKALRKSAGRWRTYGDLAKDTALTYEQLRRAKPRLLSTYPAVEAEEDADGGRLLLRWPPPVA